MTYFLFCIAILALLHGALIVILPSSTSWDNTVRWYRRSSLVAFSVLVVCIVLWLSAAVASDRLPYGFSVTKALYRFAQANPYISGTVCVSLFVALIVAAVEVLWVNPFQRTSKRPAAVWYLWFFTTIIGSFIVSALSDQFLGSGEVNQQSLSRIQQTTDSVVRSYELRSPQFSNLKKEAEEAASLALEKRKIADEAKNTTEEEIKAANNLKSSAKEAEDDSKSKADRLATADAASRAYKTAEATLNTLKILRESPKTYDQDELAERRVMGRKAETDARDAATEAKKAAETVGIDSKLGNYASEAANESLKAAELIAFALNTNSRLSFGFAVLLGLGLLYWVWIGSVMYRRLTERDKLIGRTAAHLAFLPETKNVHPAQCIVIGPRFSGKTEFLRCIEKISYLSDPNSPTKSTQAPVAARLFRDHCDVSIIDCGGEYMKDQLDLLSGFRTDCLVVVICAAYFKNSKKDLQNESKWRLDKITDLIDQSYDIGVASRVGETAASFFQALYYATNQSSSIEHTEHLGGAEVQRVLVVLNNRDSETTEPCASSYEHIPINCLEVLADSISKRFPRSSSSLTSAALKIRLDTEGRRTAHEKEWSDCLTNPDDRKQFLGFTETVAGKWTKSADTFDSSEDEMPIAATTIEEEESHDPS